MVFESVSNDGLIGFELTSHFNFATVTQYMPRCACPVNRGICPAPDRCICKRRGLSTVPEAQRFDLSQLGSAAEKVARAFWTV